MPRRQLAPILTLWASAYLGCVLFLLADLSPQESVPTALLGELSWLALMGSIPGSSFWRQTLLESQHVLHILQARSLACYPLHRLQ